MKHYDDDNNELIINDKVNKAVELIMELYNMPDGVVGSYGHIVFDDGNIETENIKWCIEEAVKNDYGHSKECIEACIEALTYFLELTEQERESAYQLT